MAPLVIAVVVQVLGTPVGSLKTSSNVNSMGESETLLREKTLLHELAMQPADESVLKSVIQEVPNFAVGSCLAELSYILRYRLQQFLVPAMEMESLFDHQQLWLELRLQRSEKILERLLLWLLWNQKVPQESVHHCSHYAEEDGHPFLLWNIIGLEKEGYLF